MLWTSPVALYVFNYPIAQLVLTPASWSLILDKNQWIHQTLGLHIYSVKSPEVCIHGDCTCHVFTNNEVNCLLISVD